MSEQLSRKSAVAIKTKSPVRVLPDNVVDQIAAGEVIERPSSVVKELVENAIDAGAEEIVIQIANGGVSLISVQDNGSGISKEELPLAVRRFATSKISSAVDLETIGTLGFRGEALSSIAAVSKFSIFSRPQNQTDAARLEIEGGKISKVQDWQAAPGTEISVENLFYNVPARRKFLKSTATEIGQIKSTVSDFALGYPQLRLKLIVDGKTIFNFLPCNSFEERGRILKVAGARPFFIEDKLYTPQGEYEIQALLSEPIESSSNPGKLRVIVNGRTVRDRLLLKAVKVGFGNYLQGNRYPTGVVNFVIPASEIDINVHPQKSEVRFRDSGQVFSFISRAVAKTLARREAGNLVGNDVSGESYSENSFSNKFEKTDQLVVFRSGENGHVGMTGQMFSEISFEQEKTQQYDLTTLRYLGQVLDCYLVLEGFENMVVVDMHAAHERVMHYKLKNQLEGGGISSQFLMVPETVQVTSEQVEKFEEYKQGFKQLGLECDIFGEDSLIIRSVPVLLVNSSPKELLEELLSMPDWQDWRGEIQKKLDYAVSRLACHGSIRRGRELKKEEAYQLLADLQEAEDSAFCPHGRPILLSLDRYQIEKMFGRAQ
jgi:DNA mismatch repair protein MutL